jgi:molybdopterin/thiamine biosynthesis adenylyltransferase
VWLAVNILARLDGLVAAIYLDVPHIATHPTLEQLTPPGVEPARMLAQSLVGLVGAVSADKVRVTISARQALTDAELVIGGGEAQIEGAPRARTVWCFGSGWRASVGVAPTIAEGRIQDDSNPLGMYFAVCFGVGEIFKFLRGYNGEHDFTIERLYASLWSGRNAQQWDDLEEGPRVAHLRLPITYLAGAGAVGQAVLLAVVTATAGIEYLTVLDRDGIGQTNRNRYVLTVAAHARAQINKAQLAAEFLARFGIPVYSQPLFWMPYIERTESHPEPDLRCQEADLRYSLVLSCVDRNRARQELQRTWPKDILGASTEGLRAEAAYYDRRTATACLSCHNTVQPFENVLAELRGQLKDLSPAQRHARLLQLGISPAAIDDALRYLDDPSCGELGESSLREFADDGPPAFAVGFVSVAAGLLLARNWIRYALHGPTGVTPSDRHYLTMNFLNGRFLWREEAQSSECDCSSWGGELWRSLWFRTSSRAQSGTRDA